MNITKGFLLIKEYEGFRANAYLDMVGVKTIGPMPEQLQAAYQKFTRADMTKLRSTLG